VAGDEDRQSCDDADDADRDAVEPGCERAGCADPVDDRRAVDDEDEGGDERAQVGDRGSEEAPARPPSTL
jgi:hypothetical protein